MKNDKKQEDKKYFDDNYFNKSINSLFFDIAQLTVHKNGPGEHGWRAFGGNNAFCRHKNLTAEIAAGTGRLKCPG